jgi:hypothetical protein
MTVSPPRLPTALVAAAAVLVLSGCAGTAAPAEPSASSPSPSSESSSPAPTTDAAPTEAAGQRIEVQVSGGQATGDTGRVPVALGTAVTVVVTSDVADEAHLHGYDVEAELTPGQPAELTFDATIPGVFELELHEAGTVLLTLQVG